MRAGNVHCALSGASQPSTANPSAPNTPSAAFRCHGWDAKMDSEALSASPLDSGVLTGLDSTWRSHRSAITSSRLSYVITDARLRFVGAMHVYEVRPRKDKRGVDLMSDALFFVGCGTVSQMQSVMQWTTRSSTAAHVTP